MAGSMPARTPGATDEGRFTKATIATAFLAEVAGRPERNELLAISRGNIMQRKIVKGDFMTIDSVCLIQQMLANVRTAAGIVLVSLCFAATPASAQDGTCLAFCSERVTSCRDACGSEPEKRDCRMRCAGEHEECLNRCKNPSPPEPGRKSSYEPSSNGARNHPAFLSAR
jgi:hypothetical protein